MKRPSRNEGSTSSRVKRKREESTVSVEECFEVWRKTRSEDISQEHENIYRWFTSNCSIEGLKGLEAPSPRQSLLIRHCEPHHYILLGRSKEEHFSGDIGLLEEYYRREFTEGHKQLEKSFYECDAVTLARQLLGKFLYNSDCIILKITEVEAYQEGDSAFKSRFGGKDRTPILYESGGTLFDHDAKGAGCSPLYVVADKEGVGAAVLIKACSPVAGLGIIQFRRSTLSKSPALLNGPKKVAQAFGNILPDPLYEPYAIQLLDGAEPQAILVGPRVCGQDANPQDLSKPWRFAIAETPWVSKPRDTLVPLK